MSEQQLRDCLSAALLRISDAIHAIEDAKDAGCTRERWLELCAAHDALVDVQKHVAKMLADTGDPQ